MNVSISFLHDWSKGLKQFIVVVAFSAMLLPFIAIEVGRTRASKETRKKSLKAMEAIVETHKNSICLIVHFYFEFISEYV